MTSARGDTSQYPIATSAQFVEVEFTGEPGEPWADEVNKALRLITDDVQRIAGRPVKVVPVVSGTARACMPLTGQARVYAVSDTATVGSNAGNYHTLSVIRNGTVPLTQTYDTRRKEIPAYLGGCYLGEITVSQGDIVSVRVISVGAPVPLLNPGNFSLLILLTET